MLAETMVAKFGIVRNKKTVDDAVSNINYYLSVAEKINYDLSVFFEWLMII